MAKVQNTKSKLTPENEEKLEAARKEDAKIVKGIFHFYEVPGGLLEFPYLKYPNDEVYFFKQFDGDVCSIPLGVAKHLNNNCKYPVHKFAQDEFGKPVQKIGQKISRTGFQSLEFVNVEELPPSRQIITVENVNPLL